MKAFISRRLVSPLLPLVLALFCVPPAAFGQGGTSTASLAGMIVDDTGARLPGVTVTVTHLGTNQSRTCSRATTRSAPSFRVSPFSIGSS